MSDIVHMSHIIVWHYWYVLLSARHCWYIPLNVWHYWYIPHKCLTFLDCPTMMDTRVWHTSNVWYQCGTYQNVRHWCETCQVWHAIHGNHQYGIHWQCQTSIQNTPHVRYPPDLVTCMSHNTYHTTWGLISGMPENPNVARKVWLYLCCFYIVFFSEKTFKKR